MQLILHETQCSIIKVDQTEFDSENFAKDRKILSLI